MPNRPSGDGEGAENHHPRVYLDVMLGKLATLLRMAGWDTAYALDRGVEADGEILAETTREDRTLVTRDRQLADRADESVLLRTTDVEEQVAELREQGFTIELDQPRRCSACNGRLAPISPGSQTPDDVPAPDDVDVWRCEECGQYFWEGSHWDDVVERIE